MSLFDFDRKAFRAEISEEDPGELTDSLGMLVDGAAEIARELKLSLPQLIEVVTERYAAALDMEIVHFDSEEDSLDCAEGEASHSTVVVMADKWRAN